MYTNGSQIILSTSSQFDATRDGRAVNESHSADICCRCWFELEVPEKMRQVGSGPCSKIKLTSGNLAGPSAGSSVNRAGQFSGWRLATRPASGHWRKPDCDLPRHRIVSRSHDPPGDSCDGPQCDSSD